MTKRLNPSDPKVFDKWRELYWELTDEEHLDFMEDCCKVFGDQKHFTYGFFSRVFDVLRDVRVMEVGGWKGELAQQCLKDHYEKIITWDNYEVCKGAIEQTVDMKSVKYHPLFQPTFDWFKKERPKQDKYDICISSNMIEHLANQHFEKLLDYIQGIPLVLFEAPLLKSGQRWEDYFGTHILGYTWTEVHEAMEDRGYKKYKKLGEDCYLYELDYWVSK